MTCAAVVIGRNEGERLLRCLASLQGQADPVIYVDSGSTDGSCAAARAAGAHVVELDMSRPFTAARARNAGLAHLEHVSETAFVQFIDGDCELRQGWIETAVAFMNAQLDVAVVAGRLRERFPEASIWNRLADAEWDVPAGPAGATGGIALFRRAAIEVVGGYRETLIAGEEPELCLRLRRKGWKIWRLEAEMAWHDIAMTRFGQWWRRSRRHGHAIATGMELHGQGPERYCVSEVRRALSWGAGLPLLAGLGGLISPQMLAILLAWPVQVLRLKVRGESWEQALFLTLCKLPEAQGVLEYRFNRMMGRRPHLIEYK